MHHSRRIVNFITLTWTFTSATMLWLNNQLMTWELCSDMVRSTTGKELKSFGINLSTLSSVANQANINLFWLNHQWTPLKTESRWPRSCLRRLMSRDSLLVCKPHLLYTLKWQDQERDKETLIIFMNRIWLELSSIQVMVWLTFSQFVMEQLSKVVWNIFHWLVVTLLNLSENR